jgi:RNA polymerase sigma-70 factor (ECF subfamily)
MKQAARRCGKIEALDASFKSRADPVAEATARARKAWPTVVIDDEAWARAAAGKLGNGVDVAGLYLATACALGLPEAIACLERDVLPVARRALAARIDAARVDEILQRVRTRLLAPLDGGTPKIALYAGRGPLGGFVRTVAIRVLCDEENQGREVVRDDVLAAIPEAADVEAELCRLDQQHKFREAFRDALARLAPRERALLRLSVLDGLSIDEIAPMYDAHRATIARWLTTAREAIAADTRTLLAERLGLGPAELQSLLGRVLSRFDLSLSRMLREDPR